MGKLNRESLASALSEIRSNKNSEHFKEIDLKREIIKSTGICAPNALGNALSTMRISGWIEIERPGRTDEDRIWKLLDEGKRAISKVR